MLRVAPLLAALVALMAVLPGSTAIDCYKCTDVLDFDAGESKAGKFVSGLLKDVGSSVGLPPCSEFTTSEDRFRGEDCLRGTAKTCTKTLVNGKTTRWCSLASTEDGCQEDGDGNVSCSCSSDYCNAAGRGAPALPLLLLLPAAAAALLTSRL